MGKTPDGAPTTDAVDEAVIDHVADDLVEAPEPETTVQNPTTPSGIPVEEQVRKEWDNNKDGGLPTFLDQQT